MLRGQTLIVSDWELMDKHPVLSFSELTPLRHASCLFSGKKGPRARLLILWAPTWASSPNRINTQSESHMTRVKAGASATVKYRDAGLLYIPTWLPMNSMVSGGSDQTMALDCSCCGEVWGFPWEGWHSICYKGCGNYQLGKRVFLDIRHLGVAK